MPTVRHALLPALVVSLTLGFFHQPAISAFRTPTGIPSGSDSRGTIVLPAPGSETHLPASHRWVRLEVARHTPDGYVPVYQDTIDALQGHAIQVDPGTYDVFVQEQHTGVLLRLNNEPLVIGRDTQRHILPPGSVDVLRIARERYDYWSYLTDLQFANDPGAGHVRGDLLVRFVPDTPLSAIHSLLEPHQGVINDRVRELDVYHVTFDTTLEDRDLLVHYRNRPEVEYAELNLALELASPQVSDPLVTQQHHLLTIGAQAAWQYFDDNSDGIVSAGEAPGRGAVIAVLDTGVDLLHPDLEANLWQNPGESLNGLDDDSNGLVDDIWGWDFTENKNSPIDASGHGTHVAGIAAAVADNAEGIAGVAWGADIMAVKISTRREPILGTHITFISTLVRGIVYAAIMGADVMNISSGTFASVDSDLLDLLFGDGLGNTFTLALATEFAWNEGTLVVAAAGNQSTDTTNDLIIPAGLPYVLSVGATDGDMKADFSNYGASLDLTAPGVGIWSSHIFPSRYEAWDGTSMAAPIVAGVAALLRSKVPSMTPSDMQGILTTTADEIGTTLYVGGRNDFFGYGRVNAAAAMAFLYDEPVAALSLDSTSGNAVSELRLHGTVTDHFGSPLPNTIVGPVTLGFFITLSIRTLSAADVVAVSGTIEPDGSIRTNSLGQFEVVFRVGTEEQPAPGGVVFVQVDGSSVAFVVTPEVAVHRQDTGLPGPVDLDSSYTLVGTGFYPGNTITVTYNGSTVSTSPVADANGAFRWTFNFTPGSIGGLGTLTADDGYNSASVVIQILARLALSPSAGTPGDEIVVSGSGFDSSQTVRLEFSGITIPQTLSTDTNGAVAATITLPNLAPATYSVTASTSGVQSVTVEGFSVLASGMLVHASAPSEIPVGGIVDLTVSVSGHTALLGLGVGVVFDPSRLEYMDTTLAGAAADGTLFVDTDTPNAILAVVGLDTAVSLDGVFATVRFQALTEGATSLLLGAAVPVDAAGNNLPAQIGLPIAIEISEPLRVASFLVLGTVYAENGTTLAPEGLAVRVTNITQNWIITTAVGDDGAAGVYQAFHIDFATGTAAASGDTIEVVITDDSGVERGRGEVVLRPDDITSASISVPITTDITVEVSFTVTAPLIATEGVGVAISAEIVFPASSVDNATLLYGEGGSAPAVSVALTQDVGDVWVATIPGSSVTMKGLVWYVAAVGTLGQEIQENTSVAPGFISVHGDVGLALTTMAAPPNVWNAIAPPISPNDASMSATFDTEDGGFISEWFAWRWNADMQRWEAAQALDAAIPVTNDGFELGKGWFVAALGNGGIETRMIQGQSVDPRTPFAIPIRPGWNLLANPFGFPVAWSDSTIRVSTGNSEASPTSHLLNNAAVDNRLIYLDTSSQSYVTRVSSETSTPYSILPGQAFWFLANQNAELLIPAIASTPNPSSPAASRPTPKGDWRVVITVASEFGSDQIEAIAAHDTQSAGADSLDQVKAPSFPGGNAPRITLVDPGAEGYIARRSRDVQQVADRMVWLIDVANGDGALLSWQAVDVPVDYDLQLVDLMSERTIDLRHDGQIRLDRAGTDSWEYALQAVKRRIPEVTQLLPNYPNPFNPETWIPFELNQASNVTVIVYNALGKMVRRMELGHRMPGAYRTTDRAAHWDGRNQQGELTASGTYFVELKAGEFREIRRLILMK